MKRFIVLLGSAVIMTLWACTPKTQSAAPAAVPAGPPPAGGAPMSGQDSQAVATGQAASAAAPFAQAAAETAAFVALVQHAAQVAALPAEMADRLALAARDEQTALEKEIAAALAGDPHLIFPVNKQNPLPQGYAPADLVALDQVANPAFTLNRSGHLLAKEAAASLVEMSRAARAEGVTLQVSSAYRSAAYQKTVFERIEKQIGTEAAERESARPGTSQHQLGMAVDFGSITDAFAQTPASRWLEKNAGRFGWSLSFPQGYEAVTGYRWESWHYRYVGVPVAQLIDKRFGTIQHYGLAFLDAWKSEEQNRQK